MENNKSLAATISGMVHGVNFRSFIQAQSEKIGVTGFVHNRADGSVYVYAEGTKEQLSTLLALLYNGPEGASVEGIKVEWGPAHGSFTQFNTLL